MKVLSSLAILIAIGSGCFAPPAMLPTENADLAAVLKKYPTGTQAVSIEVEPGVQLRGVFVPSDADAPIVLHLLESSGSCAAQRFHFGHLTRQLSDLGFASLIVDYTGVGASDGERSVKHLERDALAMWQEALRRAGSESRVYLRTTSLGAIPAALLLKHGARPAGIVLIAPVFADSATERFARTFHGRIAGWGASLLFRDIAEVDITAELAKAKIPACAITAKDDLFLPEPDRQRIASALYQGNSRVHVRPGGHMQLCLEAHLLLREEASFFTPCCSEAALAARVDRVLSGIPDSVAERFAMGSEARQRLERLAAWQLNGDPVAVAAAAISISRASCAARLLWLLAARPHPPLDFEELCDVLSLQDPAGDLPIELIESISLSRDLYDRFGFLTVTMGPEGIARATLGGGLHSGDVSWCSTTTLAEDQSVRIEHDGAELWQALLDRGLSESDVARQFMRIELRARGIPARLRFDADGTPAVEFKRKDAWTLLDPTKLPPAPTSFSGTINIR